MRMQSMMIMVFVCSALGGCTLQKQKDETFQSFAKEWSKGIRAQQAIPVYPLTEDLCVGDVFLVDRPVEDEAELFNESGFLPLTRQIGRVKLTGATSFYQDHAGWPDEPGKRPGATFATFAFDITRGGSVGAGFPVEGVPVAFGLLGTDSASGSVSLHDASSTAIDEVSLKKDLQLWAKTQDLKEFRPRYVYDKASERYVIRYYYLRVVTKVYRVGKLAVTMTNNGQLAADVEAGVANNLKVLAPSGQPAEGAKSVIDALNAGLTKNTTDDAAEEKPTPAPAPGGAPVPAVEKPAMGARIKYYQVTNSSVSLDETLPNPMVVGYLAIDVPIAADGKLGTAPTNTRLRLDRGGKVRSAGLVKDWANEHPDARNLVTQWAGDNQDWLKDRDLPLDGGALWSRLTDQSFVSRLFTKNTMEALNSRVISEIIELPEGLDRAAEVKNLRLLSVTTTGTVSADRNDAGYGAFKLRTEGNSVVYSRDVDFNGRRFDAPPQLMLTLRAISNPENVLVELREANVKEDKFTLELWIPKSASHQQLPPTIVVSWLATPRE